MISKATNTLVSLEMTPSTDTALTTFWRTMISKATNTLVNTKMANGMGKAPTPLLMEEEMLANSKTVF